jgi:hypothetical protein
MFNPRYLFIFLACVYSQTNIANDGFYQGAGSTLRPLYNPEMRVIEEKLWISPTPQPKCYQLRFRGVVLEDWNLAPTKKTDALEPTEFAQISHEFPCSKKSLESPKMDILVSIWQARADYYVEALADQTRVKMGFPLPTWGATYHSLSDEWDEVPTPSVANFRTFINGQAINKLQLAWLEVPNPANKNATKTLGYVWEASFKKGEKYTLRTEYDFGTDYQTGFEADLEGETSSLWFMPNAEGHQRYPLAINLKYYLSPLLAWGAKPPEKISIFVKRPTAVPISYLIPAQSTPACVEKEGLYYEYRNRYPDTELVVSMPHWFHATWKNPEKWTVLSTAKQWKQWQQNLGGNSVQIACDALGSGGSALSKGECVKQCSIKKLPEVKL